MRFSVVNLGCKVNRVESDGFAAALRASGMRSDDRDPDAVIVNTCAVTGEAEKKTRKAVRRALREHPDATVYVTGCAAVLDPGAYSSMGERVRVVPKGDVVGAVAAGSGFPHEQAPASGFLRVGGDYPTRVGLKIQDGCDNDCSFCIVRVARGKSASRPIDRCLEEARALVRAGVREIVLTGIDIGDYRWEGAGLVDLLEGMLRVVPDGRLRISSIEPQSITPELIALISRSQGRVCRHMHIPLQSGSGKVLREMNRRYGAEDFGNLVDSLYRSIPQLSLSTDIIVGFPGETEKDFQDTLDAVHACRFSKVHVFRYSRRAGTPAAERPDQVEPAIVADRAARLQEAAARVRLREQRLRIGTRESVLVEKSGMATSESYFPVRVPQDMAAGSLVECLLADLDETGVFCAYDE